MKNKVYFSLSKSLQEEDKNLQEKMREESQHVGYYNLPYQEVEEILAFAENMDQSIENIVVLGIGGSSLGAKAIYEFLKPLGHSTRKLYFFESTDPLNIADTLKKLDMSKTHTLVISKSGSTVETLSIFKFIYAPNPKSSQYTFITDKGSNLEMFANEIGSQCFYLPLNVGGRFSVLSVVGLIPLALCGIDIRLLLDGAKEVRNSFFENGPLHETMQDKAYYYAHNNDQYNINCIFAYSETLKYFTEWYVQLWGESLGKIQRTTGEHIGLTPIGLIGPKDQHSFLQLIMEGKRDKSVTFIKLESFEHELFIPPVSLKHLESLDMLNNLAFDKLITMQCDSVIEALIDTKDVPLDEITIPSVSEESIGALIYYYELLTSMVGELLDVNTYDQPGVEAGKIILKKKLTENL